MIYVAGYCRVSTDSHDQASSFDSQQRYFRDYITRHPAWELYDIYADEGITGTSTKKRVQFNRMMDDAYSGKFKLILTKEVSRFSRNLLDTISYTRELKALGIGVIFLNDGFNSLDPDAELRLSIMGSIAQEESRKTSSRVKWGQTRQMERGVVFGTSLLGYDVKNGKITINPEGAEIVRLIFHKYGIEKKGTSRIARELTEAGFRTLQGGENWSAGHIIKILRNEKYVGDLIQKKTITPDYLTHAKRPNRGEEELIFLPNHHEPIIDRALWDTVQEELSRRSRPRNAAARSVQYLFSGKIFCGECGAGFVARRKKRKDGTSYLRWQCSSALKTGGCTIGRLLRDDVATDALLKAVASIPMDRGGIARNLTQILTACSDPDSTDHLNQQIRKTQKKKEAAIDAYLCGILTAAELQNIKTRYDKKISELCEHQEVLRAARTSAADTDRIWQILAGERFSEAFCRNLLESITLHRDGSFHIRLREYPPIFCFQLPGR